MYPVIKRFKDRDTGTSYRIGDFYEGSRGKELQEKGFLGPGKDEYPIDLGGGWYQMADGRKVRKAELKGEQEDTEKSGQNQEDELTGGDSDAAGEVSALD